MITIGSPLEKIRWLWLWPSTMATDVVLTDKLMWHNTRDRLDGVSGKLRHFGSVRDIPMIGRANLVNAHVAYERNPAFVRLLLDLVGSHALPVCKTVVSQRIWLAVASIAASAVCMVVALAVAAAGLVAVVLGLVVFVILTPDERWTRRRPARAG